MVPNFFIARLTASFIHYNNSTQIQLGSLLLHKHNASLFLFNTFTSDASSGYESDANNHKGDTFTVSYLINSCGLSPKLAMKLSNRVRLKNPNAPNAVLDLLKNYGFSKTQIAKLVEKHPKILYAKSENTLLPKLMFFRSIGFSKTDMPKILIANHTLLLRSLKNCLIPRYEILRSVVRDDKEVVRTFKCSPWRFARGDMMNNLVPNIEVLRQCGVPQAFISLFMINSRAAPHAKHSEFVEAINTAKQIGLNPLRATFVEALETLVMKRDVWESRFEVYERWGWNREMTLRAFRKFPGFMRLSEEIATKKMSILVKDIGLSSEDIAEYPQVLAYNLEKRVIPRFLVVKILKSKGLLKNSLRCSSFICLSEEKFLKKFVVNFEKDLPLLADVYKGVIKHSYVM